MVLGPNKTGVIQDMLFWASTNDNRHTYRDREAPRQDGDNSISYQLKRAAVEWELSEKSSGLFLAPESCRVNVFPLKILSHTLPLILLVFIPVVLKPDCISDLSGIPSKITDIWVSPPCNPLPQRFWLISSGYDLDICSFRISPGECNVQPTLRNRDLHDSFKCINVSQIATASH